MSLSYFTRPLYTIPAILCEGESEAKSGIKLLASPISPLTIISPYAGCPVLSSRGLSAEGDLSQAVAIIADRNSK